MGNKREVKFGIKQGGYNKGLNISEILGQSEGPKMMCK